MSKPNPKQYASIPPLTDEQRKIQFPNPPKSLKQLKADKIIVNQIKQE